MQNQDEHHLTQDELTLDSPMRKQKQQRRKRESDQHLQQTQALTDAPHAVVPDLSQTVTPIPGDPLSQKMEKLRQSIINKQRANELAAQDSSSNNQDLTQDEAADEQQEKPFHTLSENNQRLEQLSRLGRFESAQLNPSSEYPTFLTRTPIFPPSHRSSQKSLLDEDNAISFNTPWGQGRKFGAPLSVYDEDTLIAIGKLRSRRLNGDHHKMPIPLTHFPGTSERANIHACCCLISDIQKMCGTTKGGYANKLRLASLRRLSSVVIELTAKSKDRYESYGTSVKLIDVAWKEYEKNAVLYIQMSPLMSYWYDEEYTYIDWNIRKQLSATGKSIHRFLSGQPKQYEISCKKLYDTIGYTRPYKKFMSDLRASLLKLHELTWVKTYHIEGNGLKTPHKLVINR